MDENKLSSYKKLQIYKDNAKTNSLPKDAYLQITETCNCKCIMCDAWQKVDPCLGDMKTLKEIIKVLGRKDFNWVTLWGGEPYLHPHILDIMKEVKDCGMKLQIITNGTLLKNDRTGAKLNATAELADNVVFSIDAPTPESHDEIRGVKGTFAKAISNLKALADFVRKNGKGPGIEIDTTILRYNIGMLPAMVEFSRQFGDILVDFDPAQIQGLGNSTDRTIIEIPDNQIKTVFSKLITQVTNGAHISSAAKLRLMKNYLLKKHINKPCSSLFKDLMIAPDGKVYFCWGWNKVIGNILDDGFKQQWEQAIKNNLAAIDGNMERCKSCGFSHVRWPDLEFADIITTINAFRKKYFEGITK